MANPAQILAKIERAEETLSFLCSEAKIFFASNPAPCRIESQHLGDDRTFAWNVFEDHPPPLRFAVMAGEVVHHLRGALDYTICALVEERGNKPTRKHHFPIVQTLTEFKERSNQGLSGISAAATAIIEAEQPYHSPDPANAFLPLLKNLDDRNKHQLLPIVVSAGVFREYSVNLDTTDDEQIGWTQSGHIAHATPQGGEIMRLVLDTPHANARPQVEFSLQLAFLGAGASAIVPLAPTLSDAAKYIRQLVGKVAEARP